ncbi:MAG: GNAT family N-acetyltransferase [Nocardioidaceae bacterium]
MSVRSLSTIFQPQRVAVVGAESGGAMAETVLRNLVTAGFEGVVYPVSPGREAVDGIPAYDSLASLPARPDLALVCSPAERAADGVRACGEAGVPGVAVLASGFRERGAEGAALQRELQSEVARHRNLRLLGPSSLGVMDPRLRLNASLLGPLPKPGRVAVVSHSGALAASILDWALESDIGLSCLISVGHMADVDVADVLDYLGQDAGTRAVVLYLESITNARRFMSAARAFTRRRPIVAFKAGRFPASAAAAATHTGSATGEDAVYDAAFERAGIVRVERIEDMFDSAELLARERTPRRAGLAIVTNAGGPGVMAADALLARGGWLAELSDATAARLAGVLGSSRAGANPVDIEGDAPPQRFAEALAAVLADDAVDAALVVLSPQPATDSTGTARAVVEARAESRKPVLAVWMGGRRVREAVRLLGDAGVAVWRYPERAVMAFMELVRYARNRDVLYETPRQLPIDHLPGRGGSRQAIERACAEHGAVLPEGPTKELLAVYGIDVTVPHAATTADEAVAVADRIGYPVVLKLRSPDVTHRTDVRGVEIGLLRPESVRAAFGRIERALEVFAPGARMDGVTVQRMADDPGYELILGSRSDPVFGAVLIAGAGGVEAEMLGDTALALPPLNERLARRMLERLRIWPLLGGHRGRSPVDLDALLETLMRFSHLVAEHPELAEIEINPLLAGPAGTVALDARAVVDEGALREPRARFSHLAILPYPEEYATSLELKDGTAVALRPIRPEDEPAWHDMLASCSEETIHMRFRAMFSRTTHEMAARYCFIDYDRELAIVAELKDASGRRPLGGVARLVADPDRRRAELAVLVADPWQGRGLGLRLTEFTLDVARRWGVTSVFAETTADNGRMIAVLERHGFAITYMHDEQNVLAERQVA